MLPLYQLWAEFPVYSVQQYKRRPEESPIICREELSWRGAEVVRQLVNEVDLPEAGISPDLEEAYDRLARWGLVKVQEDGLQLTAKGRRPTAFAHSGGEISWEGM
eukprot:s2189_g11.t1